MSASDQLAYEARLGDALDAREALQGYVTVEHMFTIRFMREALRQQKNWTQIGRALNISATGARRYYERNRLKVER